MDIIQAFVLNNTQHYVTIHWKDNKPLFRASEVAKIVSIGNISQSLTSFDDDEKVITKTDTPGGMQDVLFLTEIGVYKLLMRSNKPLAKPFQKWVCKVLATIRETGEYKLQCETKEAISFALKQEADKHAKHIEQVQHDTLVEAYKGRYLVYFGIIKELEPGKFLMKIGSTKDIVTRSQSLISQFGSFTIFKIFECSSNEAFEKFLHKHRNIVKFSYKAPVYDEYVSNGEIFLVSKDEIQTIINVAVHNKFKFVNQADAETILEIEKTKLKQIQAEAQAEAEAQAQAQAQAQIEVEKIKAIQQTPVKPKFDLDVLQFVDNRRHTQTRGDKIQRYCPEGKELIKTYASYAFAIRDAFVLGLSRSGIKEAIKNNTIYKGYRWASLKRSCADDTIQLLEPSRENKSVKIGFVAMLNLDKTHIVRVFCDQKEAAVDRKFTSSASISNAIKRDSKSSGHYFKMWDDCDAALKSRFLQSNDLPQKRQTVMSQPIEQRHPFDNSLIANYASHEDVIRKFKVSRLTLKSAIEFGYIIKGYKWCITKSKDAK
jgi:prophage antirepressor-like protein